MTPPNRRLAPLAALALGAGLIAGCGGDSAAVDAAPADPSDAGPDAAPADAPGPDADLRPSHCAATGPVPAWVDPIADYQVVAHCAGVDLAITALDGATVRLRYTEPDAAPADRSWAVPAQPAGAAEVWLGADDDRLELCTPELSVRVAPESCRLVIADADRRTLVDDGDDGGFARDGDAFSVVRHTPSGERFYGLGEKTGPLDRRGRRLELWNTDPFDPDLGGYPADQDPLYQSIPLVIGLRDGVAYGVFTDDSYHQVVDLAATAADRYSVTAAGGTLDQYVLAGPDLADVVERYTALTGRPPLPPRWALGFHQSRWGYAPADQLAEIAARFRSEQIPADGLWLDIQHMDGFRTFTWDPVAFPDPAGLLAGLAGLGFKVTAIADPGIKIDPGWSVYQSGVDGGCFLRTADDQLYQGYVWPGPSVFPDFTSPAARDWWAAQIAAPLASGVRGIWLDVNEPTNFPEAGGSTIPDDVPAAGDGVATTMAEAHNVYALEEARATYAGMVAAAPSRRPFVLSRAGYAGIQRYAAVWTGDAVSDWDHLRGTLPMLLGMGLSGLAAVGSDVGGYSGNASPELYARWMALGSISPFFRAHVTSGVPGQEPWQFGIEVRDISRKLIGERYRMLPYWYSLFAEAAATGAPPLRPLVYEFQDDPAVADLGDQAMIGRFLLAAPVLEAGATSRTLYLPAGRWFELHSGAIYQGPTTITVPVTLAALPLYVREGAILPRAPVMQYSDQTAIDPLSLELYPGPDESRFTLYEDSGDGFAYADGERSEITYRLQRLDDGARLIASPRQGSYVPPSRRLEIRLRRVDAAPTAVARDGVALPGFADYPALVAAGQGWWRDAADRSVVVLLADRDDFTLRWSYDPAIADPRPPVAVAIEVEVPEGTPTDTPIYISTSASGWTQQPLTWTDSRHASGSVTVPRGEWFYYKYTRGDWDTVEKWPDCAEASDRYRFGAAIETQVDTVYGWRDWCP